MKKLRFLTAGESHGKALVGIIEGVPSGLALTVEELHAELRRRKLGFGRGARQKMEDDRCEILSGVRHGRTLGSPIALMIANQDWKNWSDVMQAESYSGEVRRKLEVPRPGHADYVGGRKYRHEDMRNVLERASARETTIRVALGAVARKLLAELGVGIGSRVTRIGSGEDTAPVTTAVEAINAIADASPVRCLGEDAGAAMVREIEAAKKAGDTLGGVFELLVSGLPLGLGSYVHWDRRLEGEIARALMSLNAIKGVEVGLGFHAAATPGSLSHDEFLVSEDRNGLSSPTNRSGGIDGGMTTGQLLVVRAAMKPLATLMSPLRSVKLATGEAAEAHVERSDVCAVPAAAVIGESLLALVLAEAVLEKFGGDSLEELCARWEDWNRAVPPIRKSPLP
ncbi:MAG: chorismate synthase [Oligoflexia bacterium]|nr:chorismate synthase [Oligoflexia bacterium]